MKLSGIPDSMIESAKAFVLGLPYIEGVWVNKHEGFYYLQYGTPGSRFNIYGDGVYVSEKPLGPYRLANNNPYSYKPGGFLPAAGHGSTMEDKNGNVWHTATMRICVNHNFERRIGIWPAGWDKDGELFCNQRYGDWPCGVENQNLDPWRDPEWMLLSYQKPVKVSSCAEGKKPESITDENVCTWWKAAVSAPGEWAEVDLGRSYDVRAVQINFADDGLMPPVPERAALQGALNQERWIDEVPQATCWKLEGSVDGSAYFVIEDKTQTETDLPHDLIVREEGIEARYLRLTVEKLPYGQAACVSGLRVFGLGHEAPPVQASEVVARRDGDLDMEVSWWGNAVGYVVEWGYAPDKLYHSYQVYADSVGENASSGEQEMYLRIGALVKGQGVYVRVDSFNESGITVGEVLPVTETKRYKQWKNNR